MSIETEHFPLAGKVKVSDQATRVAKSLKELPPELRETEAKLIGAKVVAA
jgi:hypothetical protein